jgi:hypothetical protein
MDRLKGVGMLFFAAIVCPRHLSILLAVLGGTTVGAVPAANLPSGVVLLGTASVGALIIALRALEAGSKRACAPPGSRRTH